MSSSTNYQLPTTNYGFTLLEVVITTFIIGTVVTGMFGLFLMSLRSAQTGERRVVAIALANERMEMVRNLPYVDVGTQGGVPAGSIPQEETVTRNGQAYTVRTDIRYVDDPYDGSVVGETEEEERVTICHKPGTPAEQTLEVSASALGAHLAHGDTTGACGSQGEGTPPGDEYNADYKQVRVEVAWPSQYDISPVLLITYVVPQGVEGGELGGTLDFHAFDAAGAPVADATVELLNDAVDPPITITTQTNVEGRVVLPGLPPATDSYKISVTKDGYTREATLDATATFIPAPDYSHLSMIVREVTPKTFFIDRLSTLNITTEDEAGAVIGSVAYRLQGTRTLGQEDGNPVFKVDLDGVTDATGEATHDDLDWDTYTFSVDGAATGYDIKETSSVLPLVISPDATIDLTVILVPHTPFSLHVTVVDDTGSPVDNATVHMTGGGFDETSATGLPGQVFWPDLAAATFQLEVDAPGFEPTVASVDVDGTTRTIVVVSPLP